MTVESIDWDDAENGTEGHSPSLMAPRHATRHPDRVVEATLAAMEDACCCGGCQYTWSDGVRVARAAISAWEAGR